MEEDTKKPTKGTWERLGKQDENRITFDINVSQKVKFLGNVPEEIVSTDNPEQVYYRFDVEQQGVQKYFTTSAWTLLIALKELEPLKGKTVVITKKIIKGKQNFEVIESIQ